MKFISTLRIGVNLIMARTFGRYIRSGWNGDIDFAMYEWRGREWLIPLGPCGDQCDSILQEGDQ